MRPAPITAGEAVAEVAAVFDEIAETMLSRFRMILLGLGCDPEELDLCISEYRSELAGWQTDQLVKLRAGLDGYMPPTQTFH